MGNSIDDARNSFMEGVNQGFREAEQEREIHDVLNVPVQSGDNQGAALRLQKVRELLGEMGTGPAGQLLDQLNEKNPKSDLAKAMQYRFAPESVEEIRKDLRVLSGRAPGLEGVAYYAGRALTEKDKTAQKGETQFAGQVMQEAIESVYKVRETGETMIQAVKGPSKNPQVILDSLSELSSSQRKDLKKFFQEHYGMKLDDFLKNQLTGPALTKSLLMIH